MTAAKKTGKHAFGVLLLAHGSPEREVEVEAKVLCRKLARVGGGRRLYALAWLNRHPNLLDGVDALARKGCQSVGIRPLLVFTGRHLKQDVPRLVAEARHRHPQVKLTVSGPITGKVGFVQWFARDSKSRKRHR